MHPAPDIGTELRHAGRPLLAAALQDSRRDTLATFALFEAALPGLVVPRSPEFNPPLWELGHIGWFQEYWIGRFAQRGQGTRADPEAARAPGRRSDADALYNSSRVAHESRWSLPLPDAGATRDDLAAQLAHTLSLLGPAAHDDDTLYFFRLALLHEDMHHEAALYSAQSLGLAVDDPRWQPAALTGPRSPLEFAAGRWMLGSATGGFAFDNELGAHELTLPGYAIDSQALCWGEYLPFVEAGGYADPRWWSEAGWRWRAAQPTDVPRYLQREGRDWWQQRSGRWQRLDLQLPACHLSGHEALAWCNWAGRRLPTEAEWERAALERPDAFAWGAVWEWTSSAFEPYPGFEAHPYRDYSQPWFGSRQVLRGASFCTTPRLHHPRYRNFFALERNDIVAGLRSCRR